MLWEQDLYPYRMLKRDFPFVMISHAAFPGVTREATPASLSRKWISEILRKKIGYRGLVISDDLEMGGVQAAMPTEQAAVEHVRAGGDIALICHKEDLVTGAHDLFLQEAEKDCKFAQRVAESSARILAGKKKFVELHRIAPPPSQAAVERLSRQIWEFSEEVRLATIVRQEQA